MLSHANKKKPFYSEYPITVFDLESEKSVQDAKLFFQKNGLVVVQLLSQEECDGFIVDQYVNTIDQQPYKDEYNLKNKHPCPINEKDRFLQWANKSNLTTKELKERKDGWPNHMQFGACCDNTVYHTQRFWDLRAGKASNFARSVMEEEKIWVDINRQGQKLPTMGDDEFLHWDLAAFSPALASPTRSIVPSGLCGKVSFNGTTFIGAPGTHLPSFFKSFQEKYAQYYPGLQGTDKCKVGLDINKEDPMNLMGNANGRVPVPSDWVFRIKVPAGCAIFWVPEILHGTEKNPRNGYTEYYAYLGYMPAIDRLEYFEKAKKSELDDRIESFAYGKRPILWPSLDRTYYNTRKSLNFPKQVRKKMERMHPYHRTIKWRTIPANKDREAREEPYLDDDFEGVPNYQPPKLCNNGYKLLLGQEGGLYK